MCLTPLYPLAIFLPHASFSTSFSPYLRSHSSYHPKPAPTSYLCISSLRFQSLHAGFSTSNHPLPTICCLFPSLLFPYTASHRPQAPTCHPLCLLPSLWHLPRRVMNSDRLDPRRNSLGIRHCPGRHDKSDRAQGEGGKVRWRCFAEVTEEGDDDGRWSWNWDCSWKSHKVFLLHMCACISCYGREGKGR